ncbi:hypothetical protein Dvina_37920 [Dactylosporangium vinaceum]|uniref:Uncharacterized protein n=1 Tax=Dactylosporangium vinaceum TaxID=53362 RepID=A0ABV5MKS6_9ACTN|nr:hypothetical protein [Dactylosporangium vinaceum]UAB93936.1 hypothetical protein Dvina_37920 [Dactylosporangium vinaceum]
MRPPLLPAALAAIAAAVIAAPSAAGAAGTGSMWSVVKSVNVTTGTFAHNELVSVSALSDTDVWAAGFSNTSTSSHNDRPLIEHWNGTAWTVTPAGAADIMLRGISADAADDAWAVGESFDGQALLAEHWNGVAWSSVALPVPPDSLRASIQGVTALSPANAWAVGWYSNSSLNLPLIEHWNGSAWSVVPDVPRQVAESNFLHAVTAVSADDIWAVGEYFQGGSATLLLHWNGTAWSVVKPAQLGTGESNAFPVAVSAVAADDVWATGQRSRTGDDGVTRAEPYAIHWNGTQWTEVGTPLPTTPSAAFAFTGVAAVSGNDAWAVGIDGSGAFAEHWDGTAWTRAALPALGTAGSALFGVARSGPSSLWAVGDNHPKSGLSTQTLTLHTTQG